MIKKALKNKNYIWFVTASLLIYSIETQSRNYSSVRLADSFVPQHLFSFSQMILSVNGVEIFGMINAENSLIVILLGLFINKIVKRFSEQRILLIGIFLFTIGYAVICISNSAYMLLLMMLIVTIGELFWVPIQQSILAGMTEDENRGAYMSINGIVIYGPNVLGALFVSIGTLLSPLQMGVIIFIMGLIAIVICNLIKNDQIN